jgi:hypothetical protein
MSAAIHFPRTDPLKRDPLAARPAHEQVSGAPCPEGDEEDGMTLLGGLFIATWALLWATTVDE